MQQRINNLDLLSGLIIQIFRRLFNPVFVLAVRFPDSTGNVVFGAGVGEFITCYRQELPVAGRV
jgi:hypothetical protein